MKNPKTDQASKNKPFGYLFTLDLYHCKPGACDDLRLCHDFLVRIVEELQMQPQSPPWIFRSDRTKYPDKAGLSGWIPLIESGIQIHTLSQRNFISIDIYSCREFETKSLEEFVRNYFSPKEVEKHLILRGTRYHTG